MPTEGLAHKQLSQHKSVQFHEFLATSDPFAVHWGSHLQAALFFYTVFVVTIILCLWHKSRCKYSSWFIVASAEHFGIICERSIRDIQYFLHDVNILFSISEIWVGFFLTSTLIFRNLETPDLCGNLASTVTHATLWEFYEQFVSTTLQICPRHLFSPKMVQVASRIQILRAIWGLALIQGQIHRSLYYRPKPMVPLEVKWSGMGVFPSLNGVFPWTGHKKTRSPPKKIPDICIKFDHPKNGWHLISFNDGPLPGTCSPPLSSMPLQLKVIQNVTRRPIRCVDGWALGGKQRAVLVVSSVWKRDLFIYMDLEEINIHETCFNGHKLETCENVF